MDEPLQGLVDDGEGFGVAGAVATQGCAGSGFFVGGELGSGDLFEGLSRGAAVGDDVEVCVCEAR